MGDGEEFDLIIGIVSMLSFIPTSLAARSTVEGTPSNDELPTVFPTGIYGCARSCPLLGEPLGFNEPSEIGISAGSRFNNLNCCGSGTLHLPLACLSISARLVLHLSRLFTLGLTSGTAKRSSPGGKRELWLPDSTMASWAIGWPSHRNQLTLLRPFGIWWCMRSD